MPEAIRTFIVGDGFLILFSIVVFAILIFVKIKEKKSARQTGERARGAEPKLHWPR